MTYNFTIIYEIEDEGGYHAFCPTLPGCHSHGNSIEQAKKNIREAIGAYVESLIKDGETVPEEKDLLIGEMKLELASA